MKRFTGVGAIAGDTLLIEGGQVMASIQGIERAISVAIGSLWFVGWSAAVFELLSLASR